VFFKYRSPITIVFFANFAAYYRIPSQTTAAGIADSVNFYPTSPPFHSYPQVMKRSFACTSFHSAVGFPIQLETLCGTTLHHRRSMTV